jgi:hypothetical protein
MAVHQYQQTFIYINIAEPTEPARREYLFIDTEWPRVSYNIVPYAPQ